MGLEKLTTPTGASFRKPPAKTETCKSKKQLRIANFFIPIYFSIFRFSQTLKLEAKYGFQSFGKKVDLKSPGIKSANSLRMLSKTYSSTLEGIDGQLVQVEAARQRALPKIQITGLPNEVVKESRERIRVCLTSLGYDVPTSQIVVHLSPATQKKHGSQFDLPIAMAILASEALIASSWISENAFLGELRLNGQIEKVSNALALIETLEANSAIKKIFLPQGNEREACFLGAKKVHLVSHIGEVIDHLKNNVSLPAPTQFALLNTTPGFSLFNKIRGQFIGKRAVEIALAGYHHLLFIGPPGVGKSMLAHSTEELLPSLNEKEITDVLKIYQASGVFRESNTHRPFRAPHHSISRSGLLGGGSGVVIPGEVSLSHHGILFLDELPEFKRDSIEGLREPLENGQIQINRVGCFLKLPSRFLLIGALNPCPCGYSLGGRKSCYCAWEKITNYRQRISGPILDRFDLGCILLPENFSLFRIQEEGNAAEILREKIERVWKIHQGRLGVSPSVQSLDPQGHKSYFLLKSKEQEFVDMLIEKEALSMRKVTKLLRVARTIADLEGSEMIHLPHLTEARQFRCPELHTLTKL